MAGRWRLTRRAKASLADIALWTVTTFGVRQAQAYEEDLIAKCRAIADRAAMSQSCRVLVDRPGVAELRFSRVGQHLVIFIEQPGEVAILDFVHARSDLPRKLSLLQARRQG